MGFSTNNMNNVLDLRFGSVSFTPPATYYLGLSTTLPTDGGANITEPSGGAYARQVITNDLTGWVSASGGQKVNANTITFPDATSSWGTMGWWVLFDSLSGGVFQDWGKIPTPRIVDVGDRFILGAGDVIINIISV